MAAPAAWPAVRAARAAAVAIAAAIVAASFCAGGESAARAEVLQAVFHPLASNETTRQGFTERCVLLEQRAEGGGAAVSNARAAADGLLNETTRRELAYAEYGAQETRLSGYYQATSHPAAVFDGLLWVAGGGGQSAVQFEDAYLEAARRAPRASINASSSIVVTNGWVHYEVFVPEDFTAYRATVRGVIVEDAVESPEDGRPLRYLARQYLAGDRLELVGNTSASGLLEFHIEAGWVYGRLAAVLFVQVDAIPPGQLPGPAGGGDSFAALVAPLAGAATLAALAAIVLRFAARERRSRPR
jgi:hypothetical protein